MWPFRKSLKDHLSGLHKVKIQGIIFSIRKIEPIHFLNGAKIMQKFYDTYKVGGEEVGLDQIKVMNQVKAHWKDVFLAAVVDPVLKRKDDDGPGIFVDNLFTDWELCSELYSEINLITYAKKKSRVSSFLRRLSET